MAWRIDIENLITDVMLVEKKYGRTRMLGSGIVRPDNVYILSAASGYAGFLPSLTALMTDKKGFWTSANA